MWSTWLEKTLYWKGIRNWVWIHLFSRKKLRIKTSDYFICFRKRLKDAQNSSITPKCVLFKYCKDMRAENPVYASVSYFISASHAREELFKKENQFSIVATKINDTKEAWKWWGGNSDREKDNQISRWLNRYIRVIFFIWNVNARSITLLRICW